MTKSLFARNGHTLRRIRRRAGNLSSLIFPLLNFPFSGLGILSIPSANGSCKNCTILDSATELQASPQLGQELAMEVTPMQPLAWLQELGLHELLKYIVI